MTKIRALPVHQSHSLRDSLATHPPLGDDVVQGGPLHQPPPRRQDRLVQPRALSVLLWQRDARQSRTTLFNSTSRRTTKYFFSTSRTRNSHSWHSTKELFTSPLKTAIKCFLSGNGTPNSHTRDSTEELFNSPLKTAAKYFFSAAKVPNSHTTVHYTYTKQGKGISFYKLARNDR